QTYCGGSCKDRYRNTRILASAHSKDFSRLCLLEKPAGMPVWRTDLEVYVPTSSERNSERVRASSLKVPSKHDVFMTEFCFPTPRIIMQRCFASTTTATPEGSRHFMSDSAICVVKFS